MLSVIQHEAGPVDRKHAESCECFSVPDPFTHWLSEQWCIGLMLYVFQYLTHLLTGSVSSGVLDLCCMFFSTSPIHALAQWAVVYWTYAVCFLVPHPFTHWLIEQWCMCLTLYFSTSRIHSLAHWTVVYVTYAVCFLVPHLFTQWAVVCVCLTLYDFWYLTHSLTGSLSSGVCVLILLCCICFRTSPITHWLFEQWCILYLTLYVFQYLTHSLTGFLSSGVCVFKTLMLYDF